MSLNCIGTVSTPYGDATVHVGRYRAGGAICVELFTVGDIPEPLATLSCNLVSHGVSVADDEFSVKVWSENEPLAAPMLASGLFEDTGRRSPAGFAVAPVWRIKDRRQVPAPLPAPVNG